MLGGSVQKKNVYISETNEQKMHDIRGIHLQQNVSLEKLQTKMHRRDVHKNSQPHAETEQTELKFGGNGI